MPDNFGNPLGKLPIRLPPFGMQRVKLSQVFTTFYSCAVVPWFLCSHHLRYDERIWRAKCKALKISQAFGIEGYSHAVIYVF